MSDLDYFVEVSDKIARGQLDTYLVRLSQMIRARLDETVGVPSVANFTIGDKVLINDRCGVKYLRGQVATVQDLLREKLVITFDTPQGKWAVEEPNGTIRSKRAKVPLDVVDKIE